MKRDLKISVTRPGESEPSDIPDTPEGRLDLVELLRLEAGKFLYEYPTEFQYVVRVIRIGSRQDQ